jgi:hypothetical protein
MAHILRLQSRFRRHHRSVGVPRSSVWLPWVLLVVPLILSPPGTNEALPGKLARGMAMAASSLSRVPFQTILSGHRSGVREPLETAARNHAQWKALWEKHVSTEPHPPALPAVDFPREIVVAVFLGEKPTGGHDIEITSVDQRDGGLVVSFAAKSPQSGSIVTQAFTQPFHIVRVATQSSGTVSFRRFP